VRPTSAGASLTNLRQLAHYLVGSGTSAVTVFTVGEERKLLYRRALDCNFPFLHQPDCFASSSDSNRQGMQLRVIQSAAFYHRAQTNALRQEASNEALSGALDEDEYGEW
jgi:hypothetical protein